MYLALHVLKPCLGPNVKNKVSQYMNGFVLKSRLGCVEFRTSHVLTINAQNMISAKPQLCKLRCM